jgi:hypothetical protein
MRDLSPLRDRASRIADRKFSRSPGRRQRILALVSGPGSAGAVRVRLRLLRGGARVTGNPVRDDHLRSGDFFDTAHTPEMTFRSTALRPAGAADAGWVLTGDLTIRRTTRPVDYEVEFLGTDPDGLPGEPRIGFSARAAISRRDFGITFGLAADGTKIVVGDTVDICLDVEAFLRA